jgi:hypothetical protein
MQPVVPPQRQAPSLPVHRERPHNSKPVASQSAAPMKSLWLLLASPVVCSAVLAADTAHFIGKVAVEWLDDDPFIPGMRLIEDFGFADPRGKRWIAQQGAVLDGRSLPLLFRDTFGLPFEGQYRKTAVVYDHYCHAMNESWRQVQRMFYDAAVTEGVDPIEARLMYVTLYASGLRWEMKDSSCFRGCHAAAASLTWKPASADIDFTPVMSWVRESAPNLDQIDQRLDGLIKRPGPHIFVQAR